MSVVVRSCGTCRERRVLCDRTTPTCQQCERSKRKCQGYGIRLSWPSAGDRKRAVVGEPSNQVASPGQPSSQMTLIHTSPWDIEMHYHLTNPLPNAARPILQIPTRGWNSSTSEAGDKELIEYFQHHASQSLTTFGEKPQNLGQIILRVTLAGDTKPSTCVFHALLAFSSIHRYGAHAQAFELKLSSLRALAAASNPGTRLSAVDVVQHIVAGMLLCSFEVHQSSCTSSQWTWYIAGIKQLLSSTSCPDRSNDSDFGVVLDWVHHHDVLARFTLRHWEGTTTRLSSTLPSVWTELYSQTHDSSSSTEDALSNEMQPPSALLDLLSQFCDVVSERPHAKAKGQESKDYRNFLRVLDWSLRTISISSKLLDPMIIEVYRLAIIIYVNRASSDLLDQAANIQQQIDNAFKILSQLSSCERHFPVFILGCEARTDEQRAIIIDLISRTETKDSSRYFIHAKMLLEMIWKQNDLANGELDYWNTLTSVISCCVVLPSLV